ncbi:MAG: hypothetical protein HOQ11_16130 [Gemmatimonadaceae bacterium]|nr:hypothetical protein [Gemmatimonadaceae bacterium]NUQ92466.1 hypothetical protein [Gemmatimonadaceae bacterium]NUR19699.1 hypothetical protein [Gemmatimonadaceae bacterium]NUS98930.1 hypothetical protein [Gemmatimonadaceae bacterium]
MPEYLSPGVFIEEIPARLKAIEGVSTSTAGFVGESDRGPAPGVLPPVGAGGGFAITPDDAPLLVTNFGAYQRTFGAPADAPGPDRFLGHAVRAFFDNGGRRAYIARALRPGFAFAVHQLNQGSVTRLRSTVEVRSGSNVLFLSSLVGIAPTGPVAPLTPAGTTTVSITGANGAPISAGPTALTAMGITAVDFATGAVTVTVGAGATPTLLEPDRVIVRFSSATAPVTPAAGPRFYARSPGDWGNRLMITVVPADRPPVAVTAAIAVATDIIQLQSTTSLYPGASIMLVHGGAMVVTQLTVREILPGSRVRVSAPVNNVTVAGVVIVREIDVTVEDTASRTTEVFRGLAWTGNAAPAVRRRHYSTVINQRSSLVWVEPPWAFGGSAEDPATEAVMPVNLNGQASGPAPGSGADGAPVVGARTHIVGVDGGPGLRTGLQALADIDDVRILAAPGETQALVQTALIAQAERLRYRFAVLDAPSDPQSVNALLAARNLYDSSYAAYYTPWVEVPVGDDTLRLPPSGHVVGIYARVDNDRGVWKAPANEVVRGVTGLRAYVTTGEQDVLNPRGVDVIRRFEGRGIRVWGGRTLSSDPEFRYINVRRFLIFLEASIDRGTQWVVFEPNAPDTWSRVVDSVSAFLHTQWRDGALFGRRPEDAYRVRCDESTMTVDDVQNGRLICEIGVAIVRPAEFVIFRIEQITGFATQT